MKSKVRMFCLAFCIVSLNYFCTRDNASYCVKGTPLNDLYTEFKAYQKECDQKGLIKFYKENATNPVGRRKFKEDQNLTAKQFFEVYDSIPPEYKSDPEIVRDYEWQKENRMREQKWEEFMGSKYTDFELLKPDGSKARLSDYIGKSELVLLEFWDSYCTPCKRLIPDLKEFHDNYKDKGLQIISISLDTNQNMWKNAIKSVDAPWVHLSDLKGGGSPICEAYLVNGIPWGIVINKDGAIVQCYGNKEYFQKAIDKYCGICK